jgi:hypothetical protein
MAAPGLGPAPVFRPTEPDSRVPRNPARRSQLKPLATDALRRAGGDAADGWAELQTVRPAVRPPRRDSQLRRVIRDLVPPAQFHALQHSQRARTAFRPLALPPGVGDGPVRDVSLLVVSFVNEVHAQFDASAFFYERFLDLVEASLDTDEEPGVCPGEIAARARACHDAEQVRCGVRLADRLLLGQLRAVLRM